MRSTSLNEYQVHTDVMSSKHSPSKNPASFIANGRPTNPAPMIPLHRLAIATSVEFGEAQKTKLRT